MVEAVDRMNRRQTPLSVVPDGQEVREANPTSPGTMARYNIGDGETYQRRDRHDQTVQGPEVNAPSGRYVPFH